MTNQLQQLESEIIDLSVEIQRLQHENNALQLIIDALQTTFSSSQQSVLQKMYQRTRDQHLNNLDLDEDQAEAIEALLFALEPLVDCDE